VTDDEETIAELRVTLSGRAHYEGQSERLDERLLRLLDAERAKNQRLAREIKDAAAEYERRYKLAVDGFSETLAAERAMAADQTLAHTIEIDRLRQQAAEALAVAGTAEKTTADAFALQQRTSARADAAIRERDAAWTSRDAWKAKADDCCRDLAGADTALRYFLDDSRFVVSVKGNVALVGEALQEARGVLSNLTKRSMR
jgi:hypothetical protein